MGKKPKIMILGKLPPPYMGPAIATNILLRSGLKNRYRLIHLDTRINKSVASMGKWSFGKALKSIFLYFEMLGKLMKHRPRIVLIPISQTTMGFIKDALFILLASLFSGKVLIQLRGSNFLNWYEHSGFLNRAFVRVMLKLTDGVIVLGDKLKYLFRPFFSEDEIFVVPNGADFTFPHSYGGNKLKVLYLANFLPDKGFSTVLQAWNILKSDNAELVAAGDWNDEEYKAQCLNLVEEGWGNVLLKGPKSGKDKWQLFADADVFVFPPRAPEGHPWVIVEAMAAGLPVISTDQGAITESVIDGENGFIVKPGSPEAIADKLNLLLSDDVLRKRMGARSLSLYREKYTEEAVVKNMATVFNRLLNR